MVTKLDDCWCDFSLWRAYLLLGMIADETSHPVRRPPPGANVFAIKETLRVHLMETILIICSVDLIWWRRGRKQIWILRMLYLHLIFVLMWDLYSLLCGIWGERKKEAFLSHFHSICALDSLREIRSPEGTELSRKQELFQQIWSQ